MARMTRLRRVEGFSLIEIAIVLLIAGIILGGLWSLAGQAWEYNKREQAKEDVALTVANVRGYFSGQAGVPALSSAVLTDQLITNNVIPGFLKHSSACGGLTCADNPWSALDTAGSFRVCNWVWGTALASCGVSPVGISPYFGVAFTTLTRQSCISLVESLSGSTGPTGLMEVNINGTNISEGSKKPISPVTDQDAMSNCKTAADGAVNATFVYRIVAPEF